MSSETAHGTNFVAHEHGWRTTRRREGVPKANRGLWLWAMAAIAGLGFVSGAAWHRARLGAHLERNVRTTFSPAVHAPALHRHDYVHPLAAIIGAVEIGDDVFVAPGASVRGDEGQPIHVGDGSNIQDGVV